MSKFGGPVRVEPDRDREGDHAARSRLAARPPATSRRAASTWCSSLSALLPTPRVGLGDAQGRLPQREDDRLQRAPRDDAGDRSRAPPICEAAKPRARATSDRHAARGTVPRVHGRTNGSWDSWHVARRAGCSGTRAVVRSDRSRAASAAATRRRSLTREHCDCRRRERCGDARRDARGVRRRAHRPRSREGQAVTDYAEAHPDELPDNDALGPLFGAARMPRHEAARRRSSERAVPRPPESLTLSRGLGRVVFAPMADDDDDFAAMFAASEKDKPRAAKRPRVGDMVKGKIVSIGKEAVFVDLGGKAEGQLERSQVSDREGKLLVKVGDTIEARVVGDAGGALTLRIKLGRGSEARAELQQAAELGIPVEGSVTEVVKGGVSVDVAGVRGFVPASQIDTRFVEDLAPFVGQRLTFRITRYEPRNLVLSRRALLEEENAEAAAETASKLVPGRWCAARSSASSRSARSSTRRHRGHAARLRARLLARREARGHARARPGGRRRGAQDRARRQGQEEASGSACRSRRSANDPWSDTVAEAGRGPARQGQDHPAPAVRCVRRDRARRRGPRPHQRARRRPPDQPPEGSRRRSARKSRQSCSSIDLERRRIGLSIASSSDGSAEDVAAAARAQPPAKLGTFADLLKKS